MYAGEELTARDFGLDCGVMNSGNLWKTGLFSPAADSLSRGGQAERKLVSERIGTGDIYTVYPIEPRDMGQ